MQATSIIPIFPLSIIQFPGVVTPLHIFEPRYRQMLKDIALTDKTFGIIYLGEAGDEIPAIGNVGCTVEIITQQEMEDGRSNILGAGKDRFSIQRIIEGEPYYQAEVEYFEDEITFDDLTTQTVRAKDLFLRIIAAGKKLRDSSRANLEDIPDLPDDSVTLSFIIAASLDVALEEKQTWLELTNTARRLSILSNRLVDLADKYELRAQVHKIAKTNGHGGTPPNLT